MTFFKFTPSLTDSNDLKKISVGRAELVRDCIESIKSTRGTQQILFVGSNGMGKSHILSLIFNDLHGSDNIDTIRLAEEEYLISSLDDLCRRILDDLGSPYDGNSAVLYCRTVLNELKNSGRKVVLFVENIQSLFEQISPDLKKLRSIIQSDQSLHVVGTTTGMFDLITSPDEPFYRFFDIQYLHGLTDRQTFELIKKRLIWSKKEHLVKPLEKYAGNIHVFVDGNPRLIHMMSEIIIQNDSLDGMGENMLLLLDQLTPFYRGRMESMSPQQRAIFDKIVMTDGKTSPTEIAVQMGIANPSVVVAQLHRLERNGTVEKLKFYNKKGVKYHITDGLFRMWRNMRLNCAGMMSTEPTVFGPTLTQSV